MYPTSRQSWSKSFLKESNKIRILKLLHFNAYSQSHSLQSNAFKSSVSTPCTNNQGQKIFPLEYGTKD